MRVEARGSGRVAVGLLAVSCQRDQLDAGMGITKPARELVPVDTGQADVEDTDVRLEAGRNGGCLGGVPGRRGEMPGVIQSRLQQVACIRVVIDDQYPLGAHGAGRRRGVRHLRRWRNGPRQFDYEAASGCLAA